MKGLLAGALIGAAFHFGFGWKVTAGLLGYLIAMGVGATIAALTGKPPWRQAAWVEGLLKSLAGFAIGALLLWAFSQAKLTVPIALFGVPAGARPAELPLLFGPGIGLVVGAFIELDNTKP